MTSFRLALRSGISLLASTMLMAAAAPAYAQAAPADDATTAEEPGSDVIEGQV